MIRKRCKYSHKLNAFSDGELSGQDFKKIRNHLKECRICQAELREIVNVNSVLSLYQEAETPAYMNQRILAAIREYGQEKSYWGFSRQVVKFSIAASVLISFVAGILFSEIASTSNSAGTASELDLGQTTLYSYFSGGE